MTEITLLIGGEARWADQSGEVRCAVVNVDTGEVTHLVIEPRVGHRSGYGLARLVPIDHVDGADAATGEIRLRYTEAEFRDLAPAEEVVAEFVPGIGEAVLLPPGWRGTDDEPTVDGETIPPVKLKGEVDLVPRLAPGEQEDHRGDRVHAADGDIGKLSALGVEAGTGKVLHVVLKEHPWSHSEVKIPADSVSFRDGIHVDLTKQQVESLHVSSGHSGS
jgi:hypothetical protein